MTSCIQKTIWLLRHPQTDWNAEQRYQSCTDRPLSPIGKAQLAQLTEAFRQTFLDLIVCSEADRSAQLAGALAERRQQAPLFERDSGFDEVHHGDWEGLTYSEVCKHFGEKHAERFCDPASTAHGGESLLAGAERVGRAWRRLLARRECSSIALVSHGAAIKLILCALLDLPPEQYWQFQIDNAGITRIEQAEAGCILCRLNGSEV